MLTEMRGALATRAIYVEVLAEDLVVEGAGGGVGDQG